MLWFWIVVILAVVMPWGSFQAHAHWQDVGWVPFVSPPIRMRDVALNVLLYVPFGYWHTKGTAERVRWSRTMTYALALSVATEFTQVFSHGRFPSATDVTSNVVGAAWGTAWARARR